MAKYTGVTQNADGSWTYRIKIKRSDGKVVDTRIKKDDNGNPFLTAKAAFEARKAHELSIRLNSDKQVPAQKEVTLADVYENYMQTEAKSKAPATIRKQDSLWENHVKPKFGDRSLNSITIVELSTYLEELYKDYSYMYVQGFLRFFYLLFGHAERMEVVDPDRYMRMFVSRGTRLTMPKMSQADFEDSLEGATVYTENQLSRMETIFKSEDGNLLTAFYLGVFCGLRISECFALRWECVDWEDKTITINRQMQYENGIIKLCAVKTLTSVRKVMMPPFLQSHLDNLYEEQQKNIAFYGKGYRDTERVFDEVRGVWVQGGDFVNRKENGELLTVNSMKYWAKKINAETPFEFKYHNLRHTYATNCAINNMNLQLLMSMMGHKKIDTTRQYYINVDNTTLRQKSMKILGQMYDFQGKLAECEDTPVYYETIDGTGRKTKYDTDKRPRGKDHSKDLKLVAEQDFQKRHQAEIAEEQKRRGAEYSASTPPPKPQRKK